MILGGKWAASQIGAAREHTKHFFAFTKRLLNAFFAFSKHGSVFVSSFSHVKMARLLNVHFAFSVLPVGRVFVRPTKAES